MEVGDLLLIGWSGRLLKEEASRDLDVLMELTTRWGGVGCGPCGGDSLGKGPRGTENWNIRSLVNTEDVVELEVGGSDLKV